jgi:hypothetical protein
MTPNPNPDGDDKGGMNITETTPITITHSVSYSAYADDTNFVKVKLTGGLTAYFFSMPDTTTIHIDGWDNKTIYKFVVPTARALSVVAYAITKPDSFLDSCNAFLPQK